MARCNIKKNRKKVITVMFLSLIIISWVIWGNLSIETSYLTITSNDLPEAFDNYSIALISDLHNSEFGDDNEKLIEILRSENPNIIAITGDLIDSNHTNLEVAISFVRQAVSIAPCYYVTGNHEAWVGSQYEELKTSLEEAGVIVLQDEAIELNYGDDSIQLIGLDDPDFYEQDSSILEARLSQINTGNGFTILLSHRPECFDVYQNNNIDLVLSGHTHGGQFRLPFLGGVVAPNQGLFPKYDAGIFTENGTTMVVSRGIGNSVIPVRINDRPEVVIIELKS